MGSVQDFIVDTSVWINHAASTRKLRRCFAGVLHPRRPSIKRLLKRSENSCNAACNSSTLANRVSQCNCSLSVRMNRSTYPFPSGLLAIDGLDRMPTNRNSSWNACEMNWLALLLRRGSSYGKRSPSPNRWFSSRVTRCIIVWSPLRLRPPSAKGAFVDVNWGEFMSYIVFKSPKSTCQQIVRQTILVPKI